MSTIENSGADKRIRVRPHLGKTNKKITDRRRKVVVGASVIVMAIAVLCIAVFFLIKSSTGFVKEYIVPEETPEYFEKYLSPVVMFNPTPFTDIKNADETWMIQTAIWGALNENESAGTYTVTADGQEIIPVKDITNYYQKYFGTQGVPKYKSFNNGDYDYKFNSKEQSYYIPLIALTNYVIPKVVDVRHGFNTVTLTVGYISSENWGQDANGNTMAPKPEKYMTVTLDGARGNFEVKSIVENEQYKENSTVSSSTSAASSSSSQNSNDKDEEKDNQDGADGTDDGGEDATPDNPIANEAP